MRPQFSLSLQCFSFDEIVTKVPASKRKAGTTYDKDYIMLRCVARLQEFTDLAPRIGGENSIVYDMYQKCGYAFAFSGVNHFTHAFKLACLSALVAARYPNPEHPAAVSLIVVTSPRFH